MTQATAPDPLDILVVSRLLPWAMDELGQAHRLHDYDPAAPVPEDVARAVNVVLTSGGPGLSADLIAQLPALKLCASHGVGYDQIDVDACTRAGVVATNTPDVLTDDVADTAIMLMLAALRGLLAGDAHVRSGAWGRDGAMPLTRGAKGSVLGIVGAGRIGQAIGRRAEAMEMEVLYTGRSEKSDLNWRYVPDAVDLARQSDVLVAATAGGEGTRNLIDRPILEALGPAGCFVNIARGSVVDEPAMLDLLRSGHLGFAGLDVFENEPNPDPAFASLSNVVLFPHHASGTLHTRNAMAQLVLDNIAAFAAGRPLVTPING